MAPFGKDTVVSFILADSLQGVELIVQFLYRGTKLSTILSCILAHLIRTINNLDPKRTPKAHNLGIK